MSAQPGGRDALIKATLESLAAGGLGAVSVRDVAARAGVSQGLIRHHFGSFGGLLNEAYRSVTARVDATLDEAIAAALPDPQSRMDAFLTASFSPAIVDRDLLAAWLGFWGMVRTDPEAARVHAETYAAYRARIERLLDDLTRHRGRFVDARAGAIGMSALLDGLWLELCLDPSTFRPGEAVAVARAWVNGFTRGA